MKIIHTADIHLGSKIGGFPKEISEERREEVRNSFKRMVVFAEQNDVSAIIISGDLFDSDRPFRKDKDFFYSVVKSHPSITFFYLRGNHDEAGEELNFDNLKLFGSEWNSYTLNGVTITGVELSSENSTSYYSTLNLDKSNLNIVMLHGAVADGEGAGIINLSRLKDKNIDYLALGHYHTFTENKIDGRGIAVYSGCLEGRGFDETGDKGFVLLTVESDKISHEFIPFSERKIVWDKVSVTGLSDAYSIYSRAKEIRKFSLSDIYRVELIGELDAGLDGVSADVKKYLSDDVKFIDVKDSTKKKIDVKKYENDTSIIGEFVREVYKSIDYSEEDKARIIAYGLKALSNVEVE
ncbi:MAG: DNA repair exonuclease [Clostridia bacterium]|nr:DNA repair exonuclease [Clostridia bacterium]